MFIPEMSWQQYCQLSSILSLPLHEQVRKYNIYINEILEARTAYLQYEMVNAQSLGSGAVPVVQASQDLTITFSDFATVDLFLTNGVENLADWNDRLVLTGNPYTSISVDEATYTIYLGGGSNVVLKNNVFNGNIEGGNGLGQDLLSIQDNGTIIEVGDFAFNSADNLTIVELPVATTIGTYAFYNGTKLQYVYLPNVTAIGSYAFYGAFNTATSPITLYIPICLSFGENYLLQDYEGQYFGTTEVDSPKVMTVTASSTIQFVGEPNWSLFLSQNSGVIPNFNV
jgi:hypothetical protein